MRRKQYGKAINPLAGVLDECAKKYALPAIRECTGCILLIMYSVYMRGRSDIHPQ